MAANPQKIPGVLGYQLQVLKRTDLSSPLLSPGSLEPSSLSVLQRWLSLTPFFRSTPQVDGVTAMVHFRAPETT